MAMRNSGFPRRNYPYPSVPYPPPPIYRSASSPVPLPPPPPPHRIPPSGPPPPFPRGPGSMVSPPSPGLLAGHFPPSAHFRGGRFAPYHVPTQRNGVVRQPAKTIKKASSRPTVTNNNNGDADKQANGAPSKPAEPSSTADSAKPQEHEPSAVAELKVPPELMEPLFCKLCDIKLNGTLQASAHYEGKSHAKKVRQYLDKLRKEKGITAPLPTTNGKLEAKEKKSQPAEMYCKLCNVAFTSDIQAKQHHNGRNHQRRLRGEPPLPKGFYNAITGKWQRQPPAGMTFPQSGAGHPPTKRGPHDFECRVCNLKMTSQAQLDAHLAGSKHRAKLAAATEAQQPGSATSFASYQGSAGGATSTGMAFALPGYAANTAVCGSTALHESGAAPAPLQNGQTVHSDQQQRGEAAAMATSTGKGGKTKCGGNGGSGASSSARESSYSMFRTPSGKYYCSSCNLSLNSDLQLAQHFGSKKHKARLATQRRNAAANTTTTNSLVTTMLTITTTTAN